MGETFEEDVRHRQLVLQVYQLILICYREKEREEVHARRKSSFVIIVKYFYHDRFSYVYERFIFRVVYSIAPVVLGV